MADVLTDTGICCRCRDGVRTNSTGHRLGVHRCQQQIAWIFWIGNLP